MSSMTYETLCVIIIPESVYKLITVNNYLYTIITTIFCRRISFEQIYYKNSKILARKKRKKFSRKTILNTEK